MSGKVELVQEKNEQNKQAGFLIYLPVYSFQTVTQASERQQKSLLGWVHAPFRARDFMMGMFSSFGGVCVELYDGNTISPEATLFVSHTNVEEKPLYSFQTQKTLEIAGHQWTTFIHSLPSFDAKLHSEKANFIAAIGFSISFLLSIIMGLLITSRQRAKKLAGELTTKLRKKNTQLKYYFAQPFVGMFTADAEQNFISVNQHLCNMLGYSQEELLTNFKHWNSFTHPDDLAITPAFISQAVAGKIDCYQIEKRYQHKDGHTLFVNISVNIIRNINGNIDYFIGIVDDITERTLAEQALRDSELKLRTIYNTTSDAFILLGQQGFIDCNETALKMFGCTTAAEFCSNNLFDVSPLRQSCGEDSLVLVNQHIANALEKGSDRFEWLHKRLDTNENFPTEVLLCPLKIGGKKILQAVVRDITERKQLENEKIQFWNALENSLNEIYIFDAKTFKFQNVNKGARQNLGYSIEELHTLTPLDIKPEFTEDYFKKLIEPLLSKQKEKIIFETVHQRKDDSVYPVEVHLQLVEKYRQSYFLAIITDITERKQAETLLRKSEQKYQSLVNDIGDKFVIFSHDLEGKLLYVSDGIKAFIELTKEQVIGQNWMTAFDWLPGSVEIAESYNLKDGKIKFAEFEMAYRRLDGSVHNIQISEHSVLDENGVVISIDGIVEDITDRKRAEKLLRESEERLKLSQEYGGIGSWEADLINNCQIWSETTYDLVGFPKIANPTWEDFILVVHPDDRETVIAASKAHLEDGTKYDVEYRAVLSNGSIHWLRSTGKAIFAEDGTPIKFMGIVHDITERKQMEEELREREAFNMSVLNSLTAHIAVLDAKGNITAVNRAWLDFAKENGLPATNDFLGLNYLAACESSLENFYDEDGINILESIQEVLSGLKTGFSTEYSCHSATEQRWFYMQISPLQSTKGGAVISHQNITKLKLVEEALKASDARSRLVLEMSPVPIALVEEQKIVFINASFTQTFGYALNDVPDLATWWSKAYPDSRYRQLVFNLWQNMLAQLHGDDSMLPREELRICCKDGSEKIVLVSGAIVHKNLEKKLLLISFYDITELKNYELELANNKHFAALIEAIPDAIFLKDGKGRWQIINNAAKRLFMLEDISWKGKTDMELAALQPELKNSYQGCFTTDNLTWQREKLSIFNEIIEAQNNQLLNFEVRKVPVFDEQEQKQALVIIGRDITEKKQAEEALKASERRFAELVNSTEGIVWEANPETFDFTFVSDKAQRLLGYPLEEWLKPGFRIQHIHPDDKEQVLNYCMSQTKQLKSHECEYRFIAQDRHIVWLRNIITVIAKAGRLQSVRGLMIDITTHKRMEEELNRLAQAIEQSPENVVIVNKKGRIEYVNEAFVQVTGYSREEAIGKSPSILASGKTPPETFTELWKALKQGKSWKGEFINCRKDGNEYVEFAVISPVRDKKGNTTHYIGVKEDITEKKHLAEELNQHRNHLEELVKQRTMELEVAKAQAEAANQAKSEFLANMSHEIRTPMNAILGFSSILTNLIKEPVQKHHLNAIQTCGKTLLQLINDILDLSKIEAGKLELDYRWVELESIFDDIRLVFTPKLAEKSLHYSLEMPDKMPYYLLLDEVRLRQILLNIIGNAIKFTEHGFIKVSVSIQPSIAYQYVDLKISVSDTGIGIKKEQQREIFEAFSQQKQQSKSYGGTGLGLTICNRLIKMMQGTISVNSTVGKGSCFIIEIPRIEINSKSDSQIKEQKPISEQILFKPARLLLVDDEPINRELIKIFLDNQPELSIIEAETGEQALKAIKKHHFDLILMDRVLPGEDGDIICKKIRGISEYKDTPIIMISAAPLSAPKIKKQIFYNLQLTKPISDVELLIAMQSFLPLQDLSIPESEKEMAKIENEIDYDKCLKLLELLNTYYKPKINEFNNLGGIFPIDSIIDIAEDLSKVAKQFDYQPLGNWANTLKEQAKLFDLKNLSKTLNHFDKLLFQLKEKL